MSAMGGKRTFDTRDLRDVAKANCYRHSTPDRPMNLAAVLLRCGSHFRGAEGSMVKPVKFAHVVYQTRRFDEMIAWYRDVFEAEVVYENPALAFLTYDGEHHRFAFANLDVLKPGGKSRDERGEIGVNHVATPTPMWAT
jgi:catechol-2,3-dioxygenase